MKLWGKKGEKSKPHQMKKWPKKKGAHAKYGIRWANDPLGRWWRVGRRRGTAKMPCVDGRVNPEKFGPA